MQQDAYKSTVLWAALDADAQRFVDAYESFAKPPTLLELANRLNRSRSSVKAIKRLLVAAGAFEESRQGRKGGGRASDLLTRTNWNDGTTVDRIVAALSKANRQPAKGQKANRQKANRQQAIGQLSVCPPNVPPPSAAKHESGHNPVLEVPQPISKNNCSEVSESSIVANDPLHLTPASVPAESKQTKDEQAIVRLPLLYPFAPPIHSDTYSAPERDQIEALIESNQIDDDLAKWYMEQGVIEQNHPPSWRLLSIDPSSLVIGWALLGPGPAGPIHLLSDAIAVPGGDDPNLRAAQAGAKMKWLIALTHPTFILLEKPDHQKENLRPLSLETFAKSYDEIHRIIRATRIPYDTVGASLLTRHLSNSESENIKQINQRFFQQVVGRPAVEHEADAFRLAVEYVRSRACADLQQVRL